METGSDQERTLILDWLCIPLRYRRGAVTELTEDRESKMASRNFEKRQTKKRKAAQAEQRYIAALKREAANYENISLAGAERMSKEALERLIRNGKRRRGVTGAGIGLPLSMAAAALLTRPRT